MSKSALVTVLDWGLGHATRCVPVINELQKQNVRVIVGGCGNSLAILKAEFPNLTFYELPAYGIVYPDSRSSLGGSMLFSMLLQLPRITGAIKQEKLVVDEIVAKERIDFILSDNRYGCYSNEINSIFIGHQLNLQMPLRISMLSRFVNGHHLRKIKNFNQVWIPDQVNGFHFSGILSKGLLNEVKYIGVLSRFSGTANPSKEAYDIVALISGPEPLRSVFECLVREQLQKSGRKALIVKGKPGSREWTMNGSVSEVNHLTANELEPILMSTNVILSRPGYSTIMDLAVLGKKAIFIPTPGQTEQEYLAQYLATNNLVCTQLQDQFDLEAALSQIPDFTSLPKVEPNSALPLAIQELLCA